MALTTTPLIDTFSSALGDYWGADGGWYTEDGVLLTEGNAGSSGAYYLDYETGETEQHVEITVNNNGSLLHAAHVHARYTDPNNTVAAYVSNGDFKVRVKNGGSFTQTYNNTNPGINSGDSYKIGLKVIGDTYYAYLNGVLEHSGSVQGLTGTKVAVQSNDSNTNRAFDDFRVAKSQPSVNTLSGGTEIGGPVPASLSVSVGDDLSQNVGTEVTLTATPTYTGEGTVTYLWEQVSSGTSVTLPNDLTTQAIAFSLPSSAEDYEFRVTATDGDLSSSDNVIVTATEVSQNPETQITIHYDGDSIGNYIGQQRQTFVDKAAELNCTATATNSSSGGHFARTTLNGLDEVVGKFTGVNDLVVIQLGTNDERDEYGTVLSEPEYTEQFIRCLTKYTAKVVQAGGKVALTAKTISANEESNDSDGTGSKNQRNKDFIRQYQPEFWDFENEKPLLDYFFFTKGGHAADPTWFRDNYHPSDYGAQQINEYTAEQLVSLIPTIFKDTGITIVTNGNQSVAQGQMVSLDATGTVEKDYNAITYEWSQYYGEPVVLTNSNSVTASFTTPSADTQLIFKLRATINGVDFEEQFVIVEVSSVALNQPPTADAGPDQSVAAATQFTLDGTGSQDTDGTIVEWRWTQTAGDPVILDTSTPSQPRATSPSRTSAQTLTFQLITVDDEGEESAPSTVNVNVAAVVLSEILKVIERLDFDLVTQGDVNAYFGRANREVMKLKPSDPTGLALDANGFMMLDSNTIEEVKVIAEGSSISSKTDSINIEGSEMLVRLGDLEASKNGSIYFSIVVFVEGDTKGVVVSSKGSSGNKPMSYVTL